MGVLESRLVIAAVDETGAAFSAIEARIKALQAQLATINPSIGSVSRAAETITPAARTVAPVVAAAKPAAAPREESKPVGASAIETLLGAAAVISGIDAVKGGYEEAAGQQHEKTRQKLAGMTADQIAEGEKLSAELAKKYPSVAQSDMMHLLRTGTTVTGDFDEAKGLMEPLARLRVIAQAARPHASAEETTEEMDKLTKAMEIAGVTTKPDLFREYIGSISKSLNAFGDQMRPSDYFEMLKYSRQAGSRLSERFLTTTMATLGSEIGGASIGTAVASFNRAMVGGHMEHQAAAEMARLGLFKESDLIRLKTGEIKGIKRGAHVEGWQQAQSDPDLWIQQHLLPALARDGVTKPDEIASKVSYLFPNRTAGQFVSEVTTQSGKMQKNAELWRKAMADEAADVLAKTDINAATAGLGARIKNFVGSQIPVDALATGARGLGSAFSFLTVSNADKPKLSDVPADLKSDLHGLSDFFKSIHIGAPTYEKWGAPAERARAAAASEDANERSRMLAFAHPGASGAAAASPQDVNVHGEAEVKQTLTVTVNASPELLAKIDSAVKSATTQVPLNPVQGGHTGRMDSDAAPTPHRAH
jgi:hypothetical protein